MLPVTKARDRVALVATRLRILPSGFRCPKGHPAAGGSEANGAEIRARARLRTRRQGLSLASCAVSIESPRARSPRGMESVRGPDGPLRPGGGRP